MHDRIVWAVTMHRCRAVRVFFFARVLPPSPAQVPRADGQQEEVSGLLLFSFAGLGLLKFKVSDGHCERAHVASRRAL